ncbi:MAG: isopentenyl-diphosphate delta-isomerase [Saprospiraceae bacterium]|nr:isopentenyl-diphosphate delta-isomerase [Saprospiraceae bacterium]
MDKLDTTDKNQDQDPTAVSRKRDHIDLAFQSQISRLQLDNRFYYEPLLAAHPQAGSLPEFQFLGHQMKAPLWVSSMTGGTDWAGTINHNLAKACQEFGFGMGLGSCRALLYSDEHLNDFDVRDLIGEDLPLYANLGIAQLEEVLENGQIQLVVDLLDKLRASGLIIHVNPLQEWLQPEGDRFKKPPLDTIKTVLDLLNAPVIVKEVGQGFGLNSLRELLKLPLAAVDFAANGGTNFARLELLRSESEKQDLFGALAQVGHSASDMVTMTNQLIDELGSERQCNQIIISGGVGNFLDGYYLTKKVGLPAIYGQASGFLKHARGEYPELQRYVAGQIRGLELANAYLRVRS